MTQPITVWWGEMATSEVPRYWATADLSADGPTAFDVRYKSNPFQPDAQGGECLFKTLYLGLSWTMSGTIRITPIPDDNISDVTLGDGSTLALVRPTFVLPSSSTPIRAIFPVPLVAVQMRGGVEISRYNLRGQRFSFQLENSGTLGTGILTVESAQLEYQSVRKAIYATVQAAT